MRWSTLIAYGFFAILGLAKGASPAKAAGVGDFYRGKQISFYIRAAPGGNYDLYSRLLSQYMTKYIPGHPTFLPINMPGGGGLVALNYLANIAPKDGTALTIVTQTLPMDQALELGQRPKVDLRTLNWIGEMSDSSEIMVTSKSSKIKTLQDSREHTTVLAVTGYGSAIGILIPLYNNYLGTKFKLIYGYPSGPDMTLAMTRGEVDGRGISSPLELAPNTSAALEKYNFLIQAGVTKLPGLEEVPLFRDFARTDDQRRIFDFVSDAVVIARPVVTSAGVPPERVATLRQAFDSAMRDPGLIADAKRQGLQISARSGADLATLVSKILDAPPSLRKEVATAVQFNPNAGNQN